MAFSDTVLGFLADDGDEAVIGWLWKVLLLIIFVGSFQKVAYGKNNASHVGGRQMAIPARLGWFMMELPALAVPLLLLFTVGGRYVGSLNPNMVLLGLFILHYLHRCT